MIVAVSSKHVFTYNFVARYLKNNSLALVFWEVAGFFSGHSGHGDAHRPGREAGSLKHRVIE